MQPETCTCDVHTVDPSRDLYASGRVQVFIAMNLRDYVPSARRNDFDRLRGGEAFASALRGLVPAAHFVEDAQDRETTNRGHDFQVFRGHLAQEQQPTLYTLSNIAFPLRWIDRKGPWTRRELEQIEWEEAEGSAWWYQYGPGRKQ